jgi:thiosulfate dehydrogenase [quinone] large subunit
MSKSTDANLAYCILRATLGLNICMHGVSRILEGSAVFANYLVGMFQKTPLPAWSVHLFGLGLPWIEMILGALVLVGMRLRFALAAGSLLMFALTFGSALRQDWDIAGLQLIYAAVYAALIAFREKDWFSLDSLMLQQKFCTNRFNGTSACRGGMR